MRICLDLLALFVLADVSAVFAAAAADRGTSIVIRLRTLFVLLLILALAAAAAAAAGSSRHALLVATAAIG